MLLNFVLALCSAHYFNVFKKIFSFLSQREELWNKWKNDGCQPFKQPVMNPSLLQSADQSKDEKDKETDLDEKERKSDDCIDIDDALNSEPKKKAKRHLGDIIEDASNNNKFDLGK